VYPDLLRDTGIPLTLPTYGVMVAVGYLVALAVAGREAPRVGFDSRRITDLMFWLLMAALVGSRLAFLAVNWRFYFDLCTDPMAALPPVPCAPSGACPDLQLCTATPDGPLCTTQPRCFAALELWRGGFVFYGGLLLATLVAVWFGRRYRMRFGLLADTIIPGVALGHAFGRVGCFFAGCCYGCETQLPWGVTFPAGSEAGLVGGPVHPTQLYEGGLEVAIFAALLVIRSRKRYHGQVLLAYAGLYAGARFAVELVRGDLQRGTWAGLSTSQWASVIVLVAVAWWVSGRRHAPLPAGGAGAGAGSS
jgi:phosphatidylglycerol:prolipoprotein diacylglycerol transferase